MSDYARLVRQLARLTTHVEAQRAEADTWYDQQCAAAEQAVSEAQEAVRAAEAEQAAAERAVVSVDSTTLRLWRELSDALGPGRRLGAAPAPDPNATGEPAMLVDALRELVGRAKRPDSLPGSTRPLLAVFGVLGAGAAYALAVAAQSLSSRYGEDLATGMPVLGLVVTLLGPVIGLVPAKLLAERRHATLDPRAVVVVLGAGLACTAALLALAR